MAVRIVTAQLPQSIPSTFHDTEAAARAACSL
jgi:hypothetical protein